MHSILHTERLTASGSKVIIICLRTLASLQKNKTAKEHRDLLQISRGQYKIGGHILGIALLVMHSTVRRLHDQRSRLSLPSSTNYDIPMRSDTAYVVIS